MPFIKNCFVFMRFVFHCNSHAQILRRCLLEFLAFSETRQPLALPSYITVCLSACQKHTRLLVAWSVLRCTPIHRVPLRAFIDFHRAVSPLILQWMHGCSSWLLMQGHRNGISWQNLHWRLHMLSQIRNIQENAEPGDLRVTCTLISTPKIDM